MHKDQRYETIGDYWIDSSNIDQIRVSLLGNDDYEFLVAVHELIEMYLCKKRGIKDEDITAFDIKFEKKRKKGNTDEPGDDSKAPYRKEHFFATNIERMIASELGVDWNKYADAVEAL